MFYETAQTIGPGWHRSYKPSHYEDMNWSPSSRHFRSPGSSPETYRRIIHTEEDFPKRSKGPDDEFFSGRRSPTFPRRIFKEVWSESPSNHRFADRPRMFKRVFKPSNWDDDDDFDRDIPHIRRVERSYEDNDDGRPLPRNFDDEFDKRFSARDLQKDIEEEFQKAEGRVHHIPIMVERRMEEMKSRFGRNSPPPERANEEEYADEWVGPQVQNLRKNFEPNHDNFSTKFSHRLPKADYNARPRSFTVSDSWDPHAVHTLPTRKAHKNSQSFDDSRHPVTPKSVYRSYSETHEDVPRQQPQHSAAFRSHSDGHCPKQTYVTKIEVNLPSQKEKEEPGSKHCEDNEKANNEGNRNIKKSGSDHLDNSHQQNSEVKEEFNFKPKMKSKHENPSLQQIAVILQNVEDLVLRVEAYSGTGRDKQYRFLDEMLTRCMLRLDDVDTEGREDIRSARKAAVREVQNCIDKLEAKADESERRKQEKKQSDSSPDTNVPENKEAVEDKEAVEKVEKEESNSAKEEEKEPPKEEVTNSGGNEQTKL